MNQHPNRLWIVVLLLGWAFDFLFWKMSVGINFALFSTLCLLGGFYILHSTGHYPAHKSLWLLLPYVSFVIITFIRAEPLTIFLAYSITIVSVVLLAGTYLGGRWMQYGMLDYLNKFIRFVESLIARPRDFFNQIRKERAERGVTGKNPLVGSIVRGTFIAFPIVAIFASLLASADLVFNQKLIDFLDLFNFDNLGETTLRLVYVAICAYFLAGIFLHAATQSRDEKLLGEDKPVIKPFLGFVESTIILGSVALLFLAFVVIQFQYFFGGQENIGVAGYTYSQYARRGFNELVTVAFFSLLLILGLSGLARRENEPQRRTYSGLSVAIVVFVMVILVSAYQRLSLAIDWHGFSRLRLYPRVFLIWVGILLVAVVVLEVFRKERYFAFAFVLASFGFAVSLTFVNVDAAIVRHNIPRVLQGKNLNVPHLASLSTDALPALVDMYLSPSWPVETHEGIGAILRCYSVSGTFSYYSVKDWRSLNFSYWMANEAMKKVQDSLEEYRVSMKGYQYFVRTPGNVLYECQD